MSNRNSPLPISPPAASAWPRVPLEPTNLIVLLEGDEPAQQHVVELLSNAAEESFTLIDAPPAASDALWTVLIAGPALVAPLVIWAEPMKPLPAETIDYLHAGNCRWAVGAETLLVGEPEFSHLQRLIQILHRAFPQSPGLLHVNTGSWFTRHDRESLSQAGMEAGPALTFLTHAIGSEPDDAAKPPRLWAYTAGLWTTGRPELEMHCIPVEDGRFATGFLHAIAELTFETGLPEPGAAFEIGTDLFVRFVPWEVAVASLDANDPGSPGRRRNHQDALLSGARVAVCALDSYAWPAEVARSLQQGEAAIFKTSDATARETKLARATLDEFTVMFRSVSPAVRKMSAAPIAVFLIKAGFAVPHSAGCDEGPEHLWFEVTNIEPKRLRGTLLNQPLHIRLRKGDQAWIDRSLVSDWQVFTPRGQFGPAQHEAAATTLSELLAAQP